MSRTDFLKIAGLVGAQTRVDDYLAASARFEAAHRDVLAIVPPVRRALVPAPMHGHHKQGQDQA